MNMVVYLNIVFFAPLLFLNRINSIIAPSPNGKMGILSGTSEPTIEPTHKPTSEPSIEPSLSQEPTKKPTLAPTIKPSSPTKHPTRKPSNHPSRHPTSRPTCPTIKPTSRPSIPTVSPTSSACPSGQFYYSDTISFINSYQGCYTDAQGFGSQNQLNSNYRALPINLGSPTGLVNSTNALQAAFKCIPLAQQRQCTVLGLQFNTQCWCGNSLSQAKEYGINTKTGCKGYNTPFNNMYWGYSLTNGVYSLCKACTTCSAGQNRVAGCIGTIDSVCAPSTVRPSVFPSTYKPTLPTLLPSAEPSCNPTSEPSFNPTFEPSNFPVISPSVAPSKSPSSVPTTLPSAAPSSPTLHPSTAVPTSTFIPGDISLPLIMATSSGSLLSGSPKCSTSTCSGSLGQITPSTNTYLESPSVAHNYLNATTFSSTLYDFGLSSQSPSASLMLGGLSVASVTGTYALSPCTSLAIIVKTPIVYVDDSTVSIVYSAADSIGRLQCAYSSVKMTINNGATVLLTGTCSQSINPTGSCTTNANSLPFNGEMSSIVVTMTSLASAFTATGSLLFNMQRASPTTYDNLRGYVSLPQSRVYAGDTVTASIQIYSSTVATSIGSCAVLINYNSSLLQYVSNSATSALYNPVADTGAGFVQVVFGPSKATDATGVGLVLIGSIQFTVLSAVTSVTTELSGQLQSLGGVHGTSFCESKYTGQSCSSQNVNYGNYFTGATADLYYLDMIGSPGHTPGTLLIEVPTVVGVYGASSYSTIVNTFLMNGAIASDLLQVYATYGTSRSLWPDKQVSASCSPMPGQPSNVLTATTSSGGCKIQATSAGSIVYKVQASYSGFIVVGAYRIYYPKNFTVVATRRTLRSLSNCPMFESSTVKVLATFYANSSHFLSNVDVTSFLSLNSSDQTIATYHSTFNLLTGVGLGSTNGMFKLITTGKSSSITLINPNFIVSGRTSKITALYTYAYSSLQASLSTTTLSELSQVHISVTIGLPSLSGQTVFSSNIPQSNYAKLVTYALADDGYFTDVSQYAGLSFHSLDTSNVNVTSTGSGSSLTWYAYVPQNAVATSGNLLRPTLRDRCSTVLSQSSTKQGYIFTTSGTPIKATLTVDSTRLSKHGGCATKSPINVPYFTQLTAQLYLTYPAPPIQMTSDSRTQYTVKATAGVNVSVSTTGYLQVYPNSNIGSVYISVTFPRYRGASGVNASVTVNIIDVKPSLQISTTDYPGNSVSPFTALKQIQCSGVYQRAILSAKATLTDGSIFDVTTAANFMVSLSPFKLVSTTDSAYVGPGQAVVKVSSAASASVTAIFCNSMGNVTIVSGGMVSVISLSNLQYGSSSTQCSTPQVYTVSTTSNIGCGATSIRGCTPSNLQVRLSDGTALQYSTLPKIDLFPGKLLSFNSNDTACISANSSTGSLLALQNSYQYATISVNAICYSNHTKLPIHTFVTNVAANLYPADNDVKFGYTTGLPYAQCRSTNSISIPGYFKVPSGFYVGAWDVTLYYRVLDLAYSSVVYDNSGGSWSPLNPPTVSTLSTDLSVGYVHLFSNAYTTISTSTKGNGNLVHIADLTFQATSAAIVTQLTAVVGGLYYNPIGTTSLASKVSEATSTTTFHCTSCIGYVKLNNGVAVDYPLVVSRKLQLDDRRSLTSYKIVNGDVDGNGLCGSEDYIESLTLYALPSYWTTQKLTVLEARSAALSMSYLSHCSGFYCGYGNYSVPFLMSNLVLVDSAASLNTYARQFPIIQFLQTQTPCDMITFLPTSSNPLMQIQIVLYSPKVDNTGFTGVPVVCNANTNVYFEVNFPHNNITGIIGGGTFQSNNTASTVVGPAVCQTGGIFAVTIKVSTPVPVRGYYAVAVGINSTFGNSHTQAAYYNIQFPRLYGGATKFAPLYNSINCPNFPSTIPTLVPSALPTLHPSKRPTLFPTSNPTFSPSTIPSVLPSIQPSQTPSAMPSAVPSCDPTEMLSSITTIPTTYSSALFTTKPKSVSPSIIPSAASLAPSNAISAIIPSAMPTYFHSFKPSSMPTSFLTRTPTICLSTSPLSIPSVSPSATPSIIQSMKPSIHPTYSTSGLPSSPSHSPNSQRSISSSCLTFVAPPTLTSPNSVYFIVAQSFQITGGQQVAQSFVDPNQSWLYLKTVVSCLLQNATPSSVQVSVQSSVIVSTVSSLYNRILGENSPLVAQLKFSIQYQLPGSNFSDPRLNRLNAYYYRNLTTQYSAQVNNGDFNYQLHQLCKRYICPTLNFTTDGIPQISGSAPLETITQQPQQQGSSSNSQPTIIAAAAATGGVLACFGAIFLVWLLYFRNRAFGINEKDLRKIPGETGTDADFRYSTILRKEYADSNPMNFARNGTRFTRSDPVKIADDEFALYTVNDESFVYANDEFKRNKMREFLKATASMREHKRQQEEQPLDEPFTEPDMTPFYLYGAVYQGASDTTEFVSGDLDDVLFPEGSAVTGSQSINGSSFMRSTKGFDMNLSIANPSLMRNSKQHGSHSFNSISGLTRNSRHLHRTSSESSTQDKTVKTPKKTVLDNSAANTAALAKGLGVTQLNAINMPKPMYDVRDTSSEYSEQNEYQIQMSRSNNKITWTNIKGEGKNSQRNVLGGPQRKQQQFGFGMDKYANRESTIMMSFNPFVMSGAALKEMKSQISEVRPDALINAERVASAKFDVTLRKVNATEKQKSETNQNNIYNEVELHHVDSDKTEQKIVSSQSTSILDLVKLRPVSENQVDAKTSQDTNNANSDISSQLRHVELEYNSGKKVNASVLDDVQLRHIETGPREIKPPLAAQIIVDHVPDSKTKFARIKAFFEYNLYKAK